MKRLMTAAAATVLALTSISGVALAQPGPHGPARYDDHRGPPSHSSSHNWRKGERIDRTEWRRYKAVDWRRHHLRQPPRGYEWREVNGNYVLAAATTGLIASIIAASR